MESQSKGMYQHCGCKHSIYCTALCKTPHFEMPCLQIESSKIEVTIANRFWLWQSANVCFSNMICQASKQDAVSRIHHVTSRAGVFLSWANRRMTFQTFWRADISNIDSNRPIWNCIDPLKGTYDRLNLMLFGWDIIY